MQVGFIYALNVEVPNRIKEHNPLYQKRLEFGDTLDEVGIASLSKSLATCPGEHYGEIFKMRSGIFEMGVIVSGVGPGAAAEAAKRLCEEFRPTFIFSSGMCAGSDDDLSAGEIILPAKVVSGSDREGISLVSPYRGPIEKKLSRAGVDYRTGKLKTFESIVTSRKGLEGDVVAVDMESYAIARVADSNGIPLVIARAVSDILPREQHVPDKRSYDVARIAEEMAIPLGVAQAIEASLPAEQRTPEMLSKMFSRYDMRFVKFPSAKRSIDQVCEAVFF